MERLVNGLIVVVDTPLNGCMIYRKSHFRLQLQQISFDATHINENYGKR
jgi:hypothetical protein